jgi:hypothetical protein
MKPLRNTSVSVWIGRGLFALLATCLLLPWAEAEYRPERGTVIAGVHVHLFFLGLASVCFLGLGYTFVPQRRGKIVAGVSLLLASSGVWFSLVLMMIGSMPIWQSVIGGWFPSLTSLR